MNDGLDKRGRTPAYRSWEAMMQRCYNENAGNYHKYGALGIRVCKRWHVYENFLEDMGDRPAKHTLDRIKSSKNYSPSNCRWATVKKQNSNRPGYNRYLTFRGKTQTIAAWSREYSIKHTTLTHRLAINWSVARALTTPVGT